MRRFDVSAADVAVKRRDGCLRHSVRHAARVASQALGGEVLVSSLVRELVSGSDIEFLESHDVELKGIEGSHRLFAIDLT